MFWLLLNVITKSKHNKKNYPTINLDKSSEFYLKFRLCLKFNFHGLNWQKKIITLINFISISLTFLIKFYPNLETPKVTSQLRFGLFEAKDFSTSKETLLVQKASEEQKNSTQLFFFFFFSHSKTRNCQTKVPAFFLVTSFLT